MNKLRTILTYLDDSPQSVAAVDLGLAWARRFNALLVGVAVVDEPTIHGSRVDMPVSPSYHAAYEQLLGEARHKAEQTLDRFSKRCLAENVAYKLLEDVGTPREQLWREVQRFDLLLVGQHPDLGGMGTIEECFGQLVRRAPRPIVAVPTKCPLSGPILVPYDGSPEAARALHVFATTGLANLGEVHVLSVDDASKLRAAKTADLAVEFLRSHEISAVAAPMVSAEFPSKTILKVARDLRAGLIVMGACGKPRLQEYLLGSVTRTLLRESDIPLFLYH